MTRLFAGTPFDRPPKCDRCGALLAECTCPPAPLSLSEAAKQTARIAVEKRRKGKLVTVVRGLVGEHLADLLMELKNACGAGGTQKDDAFELQGDHAQRIGELLKNRGFRVETG